VEQGKQADSTTARRTKTPVSIQTPGFFFGRVRSFRLTGESR